MKRPTPAPLLEILRVIERQTDKLTAAAANLDVTRKFTLDGRLVGDIGEVLVAQWYELVLDETQQTAHDGTTTIHGQSYRVQVKCRKATDKICFSSIPELLVVVEFSQDWSEWEVVYNGTGDPVRTRALAKTLQIDEERRIRRNEQKASVDLALKDFRDQVSATMVPERAVPMDIFSASAPLAHP